MWLQAWGTLLLTGPGNHELLRSISTSATDHDMAAMRYNMFLLGQTAAAVFFELPMKLKKTVQDINVCVDGPATEFVDGLWTGRIGSRRAGTNFQKSGLPAKEEINSEEEDGDKGSERGRRGEIEGVAVALWSLQDYLELLNASNYRVGATYVLVGPLQWLRSRLDEIQHLVFINKINIKKTQWILVCTSNDSVRSEDLKSNIPEGVHLLFLKLDIQVSRHPKASNTSMTRYSAFKTIEDEVRVNVFLAVSPGDGNVVLKEAARWSQSSGLVSLRTLQDDPFFDFHGRKLFLSCLHKPGVFEVYSRRDGAQATTLEEASGYIPDMMKVLQERLNFTNALRVTRGFGLRLPNGSWGGMVGALVRREADLSPLDFTPTFDRTKVVELSEWIGTDPIIIISQAPRPLVKPFLLLEVFTPQVWASVVGAGVVTGVLLWLLEAPLLSSHQSPSGALLKRRRSCRGNTEGGFWERSDEGGDGDAEEGSEGKNLTSWWSWGRGLSLAATALKLLVTQGSRNWPRSWSPRVLSATFFLVVISATALYQGYIIAFLAVPRSTKPLDSADDLMDRLDVMAPVARTKTVYYRFLTTFPPFRPVAEKLRFYEDAFLNTWDFFNLIDIGEVILIDTYSSAFGRKANFETRTETCKFYVARDVLQPNLDVMVHPMNSVFGRQFDQTIRWLRSFGMMDHFKAKYYAASCEKAQRKRDAVSLTLTQVQGAFYILVVGLVLSLLMLFVELLLNSCT